jgi:hypothetical protein
MRCERRRCGETQGLACLITRLVWWTTLAISAAAAWFEWQYRRHRARQRREEEQLQPEEAARKPVSREEDLLPASEKTH